MSAEQIIVVRRRGKRSHGKHASSAWKIAFADFTLSMMAVFLVMWVVSTASPSEKAIIGKYFSDPNSIFLEGGNPSLIDMGYPDAPVASMLHEQPQTSLSNHSVGNTSANDVPIPTDSPLWELVRDLTRAGLVGKQSDYRGNLRLEFIPQGVRIDISESLEKSMFDRGSEHLTPYFEDLLLALAPHLAEANRALSITGHSDGTNFSRQHVMDNWYLSSYRANEVRQTLIYGGFPEERIVQVAAMADRSLIDKDNPSNPVNRRVEIVVMTADSETRLTGVDHNDLSVVVDSGDGEKPVEVEKVLREFDTERMTDVRRQAEENRMPEQG